MSEREENGGDGGGVDASSRLLNGEKQISLAGDLDRTARPTKNKETAKQLKIVEKESKYGIRVLNTHVPRKSYSVRPPKKKKKLLKHFICLQWIVV